MKTGSEKLDKAMDNILDCFGGADGGVTFARLVGLVSSLEAKGKAGDDNADKVLQVVYQFSRLIDVAKGVDNAKR